MFYGLPFTFVDQVASKRTLSNDGYLFHSFEVEAIVSESFIRGAIGIEHGGIDVV